MAQQQQERDDSDRKAGVQFDAPGLQAEVSEQTATTFLQYTGKSWNWVVISVAVSIFFLALCLGLSWLI
jgi:hypothetical protein